MNLNIVANSRFKARSFDDLLKPLAMYTQEYNAIEQGVNELDTKASVWENMANEQRDPRAYKMYKDYADDLKSAADSLATSGLSNQSRNKLMKLKARYSQEIVPIEQAFQNRAEEMKEQQAGRARGMVYEGSAALASLDRYLGNPTIRYGMANAQEGFQRVATAATALSKKLREYGRGKALDAYTKTWLQEHGYRDNEISQAISDIQGALQGDRNPRGTNILTSILANEMQTSGVNAWDNQDARMDYYNRIAPALYQAVGQTQVGTYQDQGAIMAAQLAKQKELARYQKSLEQPQPTDDFASRSISILDASGDLKGMTDLQKKLTATKYHNGALASRYFGKTFNNPIKIYKEYQQLLKKHPSKAVNTDGFGYQGKEGAVRQQVEGRVAAQQNALDFIKKKYGVSDILSAKEVQYLKDLGYTDKSTMSDFRNNMLNKINTRAMEHSYSSVNLADLDVSRQWIENELNTRDANDNFKNVLWEMENNGKIGKPIDSIKDLGLESKDRVTDVYYGIQNPNKIVLQIGNKRVLANPSIISAEATNLINLGNRLLYGTSDPIARNEIQKRITSELRNLLIGYNKTRSKTDSKI